MRYLCLLASIGVLFSFTPHAAAETASQFCRQMALNDGALHGHNTAFRRNRRSRPHAHRQMCTCKQNVQLQKLLREHPHGGQRMVRAIVGAEINSTAEIKQFGCALGANSMQKIAIGSALHLMQQRERHDSRKFCAIQVLSTCFVPIVRDAHNASVARQYARTRQYGSNSPYVPYRAGFAGRSVTPHTIP